MVLLLYSISSKGYDVASADPPDCGQVGQNWISPIDGAELVCVPGGDFVMGALESDTQAGDDEKPQHTVYVRPLCNDNTEITNAMVPR
jgi:formylglycine-generating enzyme required for sulfatase activity